MKVYTLVWAHFSLFTVINVGFFRVFFPHSPVSKKSRQSLEMNRRRKKRRRKWSKLTLSEKKNFLRWRKKYEKYARLCVYCKPLEQVWLEQVKHVPSCYLLFSVEIYDLFRVNRYKIFLVSALDLWLGTVGSDESRSLQELYMLFCNRKLKHLHRSAVSSAYLSIFRVTRNPKKRKECEWIGKTAAFYIVFSVFVTLLAPKSHTLIEFSLKGNHI